eukprot:gb/GECG01010213.1/.p1 GENE.gb/GECG01010213.1/~~gb/GECG01010213.1/.p1  ORF type:complete len:481 (+),score=56.93 gb/GECG01010213.1/:1-1443(+)
MLRSARRLLVGSLRLPTCSIHATKCSLSVGVQQATPRTLCIRFQSNEAGDGGEQQRQMDPEKLVEDLKKTVSDRESQMMEDFKSSARPEEAWMMHFYQHRNMDYTLPAIRRMTDSDTIRTNAPVLSRVIFFLARTLETASATALAGTAMQLPLISRLDALDILATLHQVNSREANNVFSRLAEHVYGMDNADAKRVVESIKESPIQSVKDWPALHLAYAAQAAARENNMGVSEMPSLGYSRTDCIDDPDSLLTDNSSTLFDYCNLTQQHRFHHRSEYEKQKEKDIETLRKESETSRDTPATGGNYPLTLPAPGGILPAAHDYSLTISACQLETLWACYYSTGDDAFLRRVIDMALPWANWANHEGSIAFITDLNTPFPDSIRKSIEDSSDPLLSNLNATVSRLCCWSLVQNSKAHEAVFRLMAEECTKLGDMCVDPIYAVKMHEDAHLKHEKMTLYPALLHLMSRAAGERLMDNAEDQTN